MYPFRLRCSFLLKIFPSARKKTSRQKHLHQLDLFTYFSLKLCTDNLKSKHCQDADEDIAGNHRELQ